MKKMIAETAASRPAWDTLKTFARTHVHGFIQQLLEDEVTGLLGRAKPAPRASGYADGRDGHRKPGSSRS